MIKGINLVLLATSILALVAVYGLKFQSETIQREKFALSRDITRQEQKLSVLQADWARFSQPSYIAPIVERHRDELGLAYIEARQFGKIEDIPMRPEQTDDQALNALFEALDAGIDPIGDKLSEILDQ